jgi:hypothetical protein
MKGSGPEDVGADKKLHGRMSDCAFPVRDSVKARHRGLESPRPGVKGAHTRRTPSSNLSTFPESSYGARLPGR